MDRTQLIRLFSALGKYLRELPQEEKEDLFDRAAYQNPWFTIENIKRAWEGVLLFLHEDALQEWLQGYPQNKNPKRVGLVLAGNIPLVGFHDVLSVLISGHIAVIKMSSQDTVLLKYILDEMSNLEPAIKERYEIVEKLENFDAVIATGSDNTSRYFDYYFKKWPHIIRRNRTSVGILQGGESKQDMLALGEDIFPYFGLGCRNISKVFLPEGFAPEQLLDTWTDSPFANVIHHYKYAHNYDYNKSIYLINKEPHLDAGFLMLKESEDLVSPISVLFYQRYQQPSQLENWLAAKKEKIQVIASADGTWKGSIPFGKAQQPRLQDYADDVDTIDFLSKI